MWSSFILVYVVIHVPCNLRLFFLFVFVLLRILDHCILNSKTDSTVPNSVSVMTDKRTEAENESETVYDQPCKVNFVWRQYCDQRNLFYEYGAH